MKTILQVGVAALCAASVTMSCVGILLGWFEIAHYDRVYPGVSVWGADLGGMTRTEAKEALSRKLTFLQTEAITFRDGDHVWTATPGQLGVRVDLEGAVQSAFAYGRGPSYGGNLRAQWDAFYSGFAIAPFIEFDQSRAEELLADIAAVIDVDSQKASLRVDGVSVHVLPGQNGRTVNVRATADQLVGPLRNFIEVDMNLVVDQQSTVVVDAIKQTRIAESILSEPLELVVESPRGDDPRLWIMDQLSLADMLMIRQVDVIDGHASYGVGLYQRRISEFLEYAADQLYISPVDARYTFDESMHALELLAPAVPGRALNVEQTLHEINAKLPTGEHSITFQFDDIPPQVGDDVLAADMAISEMVSSATTFFTGSGGPRLNNITVGGTTMHGVLVPPGEVFSFNRFLGDVSLDTGFAEAWIIYGGRTIQGVGGGICQVSTTAFRAAFFGGYPTIERNPHAYRVGYYEQGPNSPGPGLDATVFHPLADFQFRNDRDAWLLIEVEVRQEKGSITFNFFSTDDGRKVTVDAPTVTNVVEPNRPQYEEKPDLETGVIKQVDWEADGADVSVHRMVERDGEVLLDEELITRYQPWQAVFQYGPGTELPQDVMQDGEV